MSMIGKLIKSIISIVFLIVMFNFLFLTCSFFVAEYITGEELLSDSMGSFDDIDTNVMFTENEDVTFVFKVPARFGSESLKITIVDPQNKEYSWQKMITTGAASNSRGAKHTDSSTVFTPRVSGMHQIRISNAVVNTDVRLVSGMTHPAEQPLYFKTLIISTVLMTIGFMLFGSSAKKAPLIPGLKSTGFEALIALPISLYIVYSVAF